MNTTFENISKPDDWHSGKLNIKHQNYVVYIYFLCFFSGREKKISEKICSKFEVSKNMTELPRESKRHSQRPRAPYKIQKVTFH